MTDDDIDPSVASVASVGHTGGGHYSPAVAACLVSLSGTQFITQQRSHALALALLRAPRSLNGESASRTFRRESMHPLTVSSRV